MNIHTSTSIAVYTSVLADITATILCTPTGNVRNLLCDAAIECRARIDCLTRRGIILTRHCPQETEQLLSHAIARLELNP